MGSFRLSKLSDGSLKLRDRRFGGILKPSGDECFGSFKLSDKKFGGMLKLSGDKCFGSLKLSGGEYFGSRDSECFRAGGQRRTDFHLVGLEDMIERLVVWKRDGQLECEKAIDR